MSNNTSSNLSSSRAATDRLGLPQRNGLLREEVFETVQWNLPVDPSAPIPVEIRELLTRIDIEAAQGVTLDLKPSDFPCHPLPDPPDSDTESRASSVTDSSQGHQSYDSTFLRYCPRSDGAPSADLNLGGEEASRSGDEFESEAEENAPDNGNVIIENVPTDVQEDENEQASVPTGSQNGSEDGDDYFININDETTFPPNVPFLKLISDKLVKWTREDRDAAWHIWTL